LHAAHDAESPYTQLDRGQGEVNTRVVPDTETPRQTGHAPVNGLQVYDEIHGALSVGAVDLAFAGRRYRIPHHSR
jgi:hypothetical protein